MKVLLVYPTPPRSHWPRGVFRSHWVPMGLAYLSTALRRAGHQVRIVHREEQLTVNDLNWQAADTALRYVLRDFLPEVVGISVVTPAVPETEQIARWAKEICGRQVMVVVGGPHPTAIPERTLADCPDIDVAVVGEAEKTIVELTEKGPDKDICGLVFRGNGSVVRTTPRPFETDLDSLGVPDYSQFNMAFHLKPNRWLVRWIKQPGMNIRTSRGCTNRCSFCAGHVISGLGMRFHSIPYVLDRLREAVSFGARLITFEDDTLAADRDRLVELSRAIRAAGLHRRVNWQCCMRVDQTDADLLAEVKSAGCIQVEYGFESASDEVLRRIGKNSTDELNRRAVRLTHEAGLRILANIMLGLPGETQEQIESSMRFVRWARPEVVSIGSILPLPGTKLFNDLSPQVRDTLDWADYTYVDAPPSGVNVAAMSRERFQEYNRRLLKYFVRPSVDLQMLRDTPADQTAVRRRLRKRLLKFALQHPFRAARLPWPTKALSLPVPAERPA